MCTRRQDGCPGGSSRDSSRRDNWKMNSSKWCQESDQHWSARFLRQAGSGCGGAGGGADGGGAGRSGCNIGLGQKRKQATLAQIAKAFRQDCRLGTGWSWGVALDRVECG